MCSAASFPDASPSAAGARPFTLSGASPTRAPAGPPFTLAIDPLEPPCGFAGAVYALGNFDGLHRGHKAVLMRARAIAAGRGVAAAVLTFEPHPSDYFSGASTIFRLTPLALEGAARRAGRHGWA